MGRAMGFTKGALAGALALVAWALSAAGPQSAALAQSLNVCFKSGTELDFNVASRMANTRAKLENPAYFGPNGTAAPESFTFTGLASVSVSSLTSNGCDIFIGGGYYGSLSATEGSELVSWVNGGSRFVIGGCDNTGNTTCLAFGRTLTSIPNGGVTVNSALSYNPITCGGAQNIATFGGASTIVGTVPSDSILATHNANGTPAATTDDLVTPKFLFTSDADMFGSNGAAAIGSGATATTDQAIFVVSVFKFAADAIAGRLTNPQCFTSYNQEADLEIAISTTNASPALGNQTTITVTVTNQGPNAVSDVAAKVNLPAGLTFVSAAGNGSYDAATGVWTVGAIGVSNSASITLTVAAAAGGAQLVTAEITNTSLADPDSATNISFGVDDKNDGVPDDDETQLTLNVPVIVADLSLTKTVDKSAPTSGETVVFTLTVSNDEPAGGQSASGIEITDQLAAGLSFVSANPSQGTYDPGTGVWNVGTLAAGSNATLEITAIATGSSAIVNYAQVTAMNEGDPDSSPNNNAGPTPSEDDEAAVTVNVQGGTDYGDALPSYGSASTTIDARVYLGANLPDADTGTSSNGIDDSGNGHDDDTNDGTVARNGPQDDEDGATFPGLDISMAGSTYSVNVVVNNTLGAPVYVRGWIDFNQNGVFDANEVSSEVAVAASSTIALDFAVPNTIKAGPTFARIIVRDSPGVPLTGGGLGEVEDYFINIGEPFNCPGGFGVIYTALDLTNITGSAPTVRYRNAGVAADGTPIDLIIDATVNVPTLNSIGVGSGGQYDTDDAVILITPTAVGQTADVDLALRFVEAGTNTPVVINGLMATGDLDLAFGRRESIVLQKNELVGFALNNPTALQVQQTATTVEFLGTQNHAADPTSFVLYAFNNRSVLNVKLKNQAISAANTAGYAIDGNTATSQVTNFSCGAPEVDLSIAKTVDKPTPATGENVTYTVTVTNNEGAGGNSANGVVVKDKLPAGLTFVSATPSQGSYDPATGLWTVGTVAANSSATLQIVATVKPTGDLTNRAEITASNEDDPDSDAAVSFDADDKGDGLPDDDEVELTVVRTDLSVSGRVFEDNGVGGATAHDGLVAGAEAGLGNVTVKAVDVTNGTVYAQTVTAGDGSYTLTLPPTAAGQAVRIETTLAGPEFIAVSESPGALPGLVNGSTSDGVVVFTPAAGTAYGDVDFGQVREPTLEADRTISIQPGGASLLGHNYTSQTAGSVTFSIASESQNPSSSFSSPVMFHDSDCSGGINGGEGVLQNPVTVAAGDVVCVLVRVEASAGAPLGASQSFDLRAETSYSGTSLLSSLSNRDTVNVDDGSKVEIVKEVRNVTTGGAFGTSNQASPGDVLEYRLVFSNPSNGPAIDVNLFDKTPAYTSLDGALPAFTTVPPGTTCGVVKPAGGGSAGYRGELQWACTGAMSPGALGEVRFRVRLDP